MRTEFPCGLVLFDVFVINADYLAQRFNAALEARRCCLEGFARLEIQEAMTLDPLETNSRTPQL